VTPGAVETQFGYHLIARDDPSKQHEIDDRLKRSVVRSMFIQAKAIEAAKSVATQIAEALRDGRSVDAAVAAAVSPFVTQHKGEPLKVLPVSSGAIRGVDSDVAGTAATGDAGVQAAKSFGGLALARFDASTDADGPKAQTSNAFNRGGDPFPGLSPEGTARIVGFAFTAKSADVLNEPIRAQEGFVVVQAKEHKNATREDFEKNRDALEQGLLRAKRDEALALYVRRLRAQAKDAVKIDESYVQEAKVDGGPSSVDEDEDQY